MSVNPHSILVDDRCVYLEQDQNGPKKHTVCVCTQQNIRGVYEYIFHVDGVITSEEIARHTTVTSLVSWLASLESGMATIDELRARLEIIEDREPIVPALENSLRRLEALDRHIHEVATLLTDLRTDIQDALSAATTRAAKRRAEVAALRQQLERVTASVGTDDDARPAEIAPTSTPQTASPIPIERNLFEVLASLDDPEVPDRQLVALPSNRSLSWLRDRLGLGWSLQPDDDHTKTAIVLIYRSNQTSAGSSAARSAHLLVDLLAMAQPLGLLDVDMFDRLQRAMPAIERILGPVSERVLARAAWRQVVAARDGEVVASDVERPRRVDLVRLLRAVEFRPDTLGSRERAVRPLGQDAVWEANDSFHLGEPDPTHVVPPAPEVPPPPEPREVTRTSSHDQDTIAERREQTLRALEALRSLEEANSDIVDAVETSGDHPEGASLSPLELRLATRLIECERHELGDVRALARELDLVPLDAIRAINDWAERRAEERHIAINNIVVEIDNNDGTVWIDEMLRELLA